MPTLTACRSKYNYLSDGRSTLFRHRRTDAHCLCRYSDQHRQYKATIARFTHIESRLVSFGNRISGADSSVEARFDQWEAKLDFLIHKVTVLDNRFARIEAKLGIG
jgi:hypothetical protein